MGGDLGGHTRRHITYVGGNWGDNLFDIDIDSESRIYFSGTSFSTSLSPIAPSGYYSYTKTYPDKDAFICRYNNGDIDWMTHLGGRSEDEAFGLAIDGTDNMIVVGYTQSSQSTSNYIPFPLVDYTNGAYFQELHNQSVINTAGMEDAFVSKFDLIPTVVSVKDVVQELVFCNQYPNPVRDNLYIDCAKNELTEIMIFNVLGEKVVDRRIYEGRVNVENLPMGNYILMIKSTYGVNRVKFVKL